MENTNTITSIENGLSVVVTTGFDGYTATLRDYRGLVSVTTYPYFDYSLEDAVAKAYEMAR